MTEKEARDYVKVITKYLKKKELVCDKCGTVSYVAKNDLGKLEEELKKALLSRK